MLAEHFLRMYSQKYKRPELKIPSPTKQRLKYHWPGNVRELQHAIERAVIMCDDKCLQPNDFFFTSQEKSDDQVSTLIPSTSRKLSAR